MNNIIDIRLQSTPLDWEACRQVVADSEAGGSAFFLGSVRAQTHGRKVLRLEFEGYEPMAIKEMETIAVEIRERWGALKIAIHHRLGTLQIGEIAVLIAVATPHRKAAFEACEYGIDRLKERVPIWKKEIFEDGEVWVAAHP